MSKMGQKSAISQEKSYGWSLFLRAFKHQDFLQGDTIAFGG